MERTRKCVTWSFDLELWPWPWTYIVEMCVLHVVSMRWISDIDFIKIHPGIQEIWSGHECVTWSFDLELWPWPWTYIIEMCVLHVVSMRWTSDIDFIKIYPGIQEIWSGHENVTYRRTDGRTDVRTDGRTRVTLYAPPFYGGGEHVKQIYS